MEYTDQTQIPINCTNVVFDNDYFNLNTLSHLNFSNAEIKPSCTFKAGFKFLECNFINSITTSISSSFFCNCSRGTVALETTEEMLRRIGLLP